MNHKRAKEWLPLLTALAEGKQIQMFCQNSKTLKVEWQDTDNIDVVYPVGNYRVAPETVKVEKWVCYWIEGDVVVCSSSIKSAAEEVCVQRNSNNSGTYIVIKLEGTYER